jgi:hypothetical protein
MILSYKDINSIANKIISRYEETIGRRVDRVDIDNLLEKLYGISVDFYMLSQSRDVLGIASPKDMVIRVWQDESPVFVSIGRNLILVDTSLLDQKMIGRRNFTVAHEGAHQILFRMETNKESLRLRKLYNDNDEHRLMTQGDWEEWQANALASCLLLPELQVKRMFSLMFNQPYINIIQPGNSSIYLPFVAMADFFGVSKEALAIRLRQLKLIGAYKKENLMDIYMEAV